QDGEPVFIECNPRTVEPGNATASGVNLPLLGIALATGRPLPDKVVTGRPGVRTHSTLALLVGSADQAGTRTAAPRTVSAAAARPAAAEREGGAAGLVRPQRRGAPPGHLCPTKPDPAASGAHRPARPPSQCRTDLRADDRRLLRHPAGHHRLHQ